MKIECNKINLKEQESKERIIKKINDIYEEASSLIDINKNIYLDNYNYSLSPKSRIENMLKPNIKLNELIVDMENNELDEVNSKILKEYKKITGINISKLDGENFKIKFDFLSKKIEYSIVIFYSNSIYNVKEINPKDINYENYLDSNKGDDLTLFLCNLINFELIPHFNKNTV